MLPIPNVGLGLHPEHVNLRDNQKALKKDMSVEGDIIIGYHPIP
jgi:hypothetical protein